MLRYPALLLVAAAFVVLSAGSAVAKPVAKPIAVKPKLTIASVARTGNSISPPVTVNFAPPAGASTAKACKGKVTVETPTGKKTVKKNGKTRKVTVYASKSAQLRNVGGTCSATTAPKLKASVIGKKLKFIARFDGNTLVKKFSKSAKLKVTTPGFDIELEQGNWYIISDNMNWYWYVQVGAGNTVTTLQRWNNNTLTCPGHPSVQINGAGAAGPDPEKVKWTALPFAVGQADVSASSGWAAGVESATATLTIHVESPSRMTGTYRLDGMFSTDGGVYPCTSGDIPVTWGNGELG